MSQYTRHFYSFGPYRIDEAARLLLRDDQAVSLEPKVVQTLIVLIRANAKVVTRKELMTELWPEKYVNEEGLTRNVSLLRKELAEGLNGADCIKTFHGRGYKFILPVTEYWEEVPAAKSIPGSAPVKDEREMGSPEKAAGTQETAKAALRPQIPPRIFIGKHVKWLTAFGVLLVIAVAGTLYYFHRASQVVTPIPIPIPGRRSVAVLGFKNLSGSLTADWLSTAFSEWLATELSTGRQVRTVPQESIARVKSELSLGESGTLSKIKLAQIRKNLGADLVVTGSYAVVDEQSGGQIRFDIRVVDAADGRTVSTLSEVGSQAELFNLASRAGADLREKLGLQALTTEEARQVRAALPVNADAARLYSQGLAKMRIYDALAARPLFQKAITIDPNDPLAHSALAGAWLVLGYQVRAREEAKKALDLSNNLSPETQRSIEARYSEVEGDWDRAAKIYNALWMVFPDDPEYGLHLALAQSSAGRGKDALATIESLRKLPSPLSDDPRIDLVEAQAAESISDFKAEETAAAKAAAKATTQGARVLAARALLSEGWALDNLGQLEKAAELDDEARQVFVSVGDRAGVARALKNSGDVLIGRGEFAKSRSVYEQALAICREIGYQAGVAVVLNNMAFDLKSLGDMAGARKMYEDSATVSREIGDQAREALALNGMAILLWRQGDLDGAAKLYRQAANKHMELGDKDRAAIVLNNLAIVRQDQGDLAGARKTFDESLKLSQSTEDQAEVSRTLANLGELFVKQGSLLSAKKQFEEAITIAESAKSKREQAYALHGLGEIFSAEGSLQEAENKYEAALGLRKEMGEKGTIAESQLALAQVSIDQERLQAANLQAQEAAAEFKREQETDDEAVAYAVLAKCLLAQGDSIDARKAVNHIGGFHARIQDRDDRLFVTIAQARVRAASGDAVEALQELRSAQAEAQRYGYLGHELEARLASAEILIKSGHPTVARDLLTTLERQAAAKDFGLIAREAEAAIRSSKLSTAR